jgi:GABA permease
MHNPLRSEAEAFRWLLVIGAACAAVIVLTLLTEPRYGAILGAALIGLGVGLLWRGARGAEPRKVEVARGDGETHRVLVLANETVGGSALLDEIRNRCKGRRSEILVVTPAITSQVKHWVSDTDAAYEDADERRAASVEAIRSTGLEARGRVGDSDPNVAVEDALREFGADEVIISTHPPERSRWLERGVVEKARREIDLPVTHVVVDLEAEAATSRA